MEVFKIRTIEELNGINNKKLIKIKDFVFAFVEEKEMIEVSPVSNYFSCVTDLSLNNKIKLKWAIWGYFFFYEIRDSFKDDYANNMYKEILPTTYEIKNKFTPEIFLDDKEVSDINIFKKELENWYNLEEFDENTTIHFKLKVNLDDFLIINFVLYPSLFNTKEPLSLKERIRIFLKK